MERRWTFGPGQKLGTDRTINDIAEKIADKLTENMLIGDLMLHSVPYQGGSPGIVSDENIAKISPCRCIEYRPGKKLCFSKGIIGALSDEQESTYCPTTEALESPALQKRLDNWMDAVDTCKAEIASIPKGERLEPWLGCMSRELSARGIEA